jgi:hypothetical protein
MSDVGVLGGKSRGAPFLIGQPKATRGQVQADDEALMH